MFVLVNVIFCYGKMLIPLKRIGFTKKKISREISDFCKEKTMLVKALLFLNACF